MTPHEEWRPVVGYEGAYEVSNLGRIRSLPRPLRTKGDGTRSMKGRILKPWLGDRYAKVRISVAGEGRTLNMHAVVAEAFIGPKPEGMEVRHLDGDSHNNQLDNLAYGTPSQNNYDRVLHGTHPIAARTHCKNGHEFTPDNIYPTPKYRRCRTCARNYRLAQKESA